MAFNKFHDFYLPSCYRRYFLEDGIDAEYFCKDRKKYISSETEKGMTIPIEQIKEMLKKTSALSEKSQIVKGTCGENATWMLNSVEVEAITERARLVSKGPFHHPVSKFIFYPVKSNYGPAAKPLVFVNFLDIYKTLN